MASEASRKAARECLAKRARFSMDTREAAIEDVAALLDGQRRDRDELWCRALVTVLDPEQAEQVTRWFNENRPDPPEVKRAD